MLIDGDGLCFFSIVPSNDHIGQTPPSNLDGILPGYLRVDAVLDRTGLTKTKLYQWMREGRIRSVCLKDPGCKRGIRLVDAQSLADFINSFDSGFEEGEP